MNLEKYQHALITGASSGFGVEFAKQLAQRKISKITLTARRKDLLEKLKEELEDIQVEILIADLSSKDGILKVSEYLENEKVDLLINNAGFGQIGSFSHQSNENVKDMLAVNIEALTLLSHSAIESFTKIGNGGLLNVASTASFSPMPYFAEYAASKAYVRFFTEALHEECLSNHISITALCPGPSPTEFFEKAGKKEFPFFMTPVSKVVQEGLLGLEKNKRCVVPHFSQKISTSFSSLIPRSLSLKMISFFMKKYVISHKGNLHV